MPTSVISGRLTAIEPGHIVLGMNLHRIIVPPALSAAEFPIGSSLTVVVREVGGKLIAVSIERILERPSR
jgi:hypothetical protein